MKNQSQHTQVKLEVIGDGGSGSLIGIPDGEGGHDYIAEMTTYDKTLAARMVRAANMHDELVKMLRYSATLLNGDDADRDMQNKMIELIKQAEQK